MTSTSTMVVESHPTRALTPGFVSVTVSGRKPRNRDGPTRALSSSFDTTTPFPGALDRVHSGSPSGSWAEPLWRARPQRARPGTAARVLGGLVPRIRRASSPIVGSQCIVEVERLSRRSSLDPHALRQPSVTRPSYAGSMSFVETIRNVRDLFREERRMPPC
jgi:hypothetical protein